MRYLPAAVGLVLITAFGAASGLWTGRWAPEPAGEETSARFAEIPLTVGNWDGQPQELDPRQREAGGVRAYLMRRYVQRRTGHTVSALLVSGRMRPIAVHTPDLCYPRSGFDAVTEQRRLQVPGPSPDEVWAEDFRQNVTGGVREMHVLWAWTTDGTWAAPDNPRLQFTGKAELYKLYVVRMTLGPAGPAEETGPDPSVEFLKHFLPEVRRRVFGGP